MKRIRWGLLPVLGLLAGLVVMPTADAKPLAASSACPMPPIAQKLAAKATRVERIAPNKVRFYGVASMQTAPLDLGHIVALTPQYNSQGWNWFQRGDAWVEWLGSSPCSGPDGYAFGFNANTYRAPEGTTSPRTLVAANWDYRAALQYDHGRHDWDSVWGRREYHVLNESSCNDQGNYHFFDDSAPGEVRTTIIGRVRYLSINHLSAIRDMASKHVTIGAVATVHGGNTWSTAGPMNDGDPYAC